MKQGIELQENPGTQLQAANNTAEVTENVGSAERKKRWFLNDMSGDFTFDMARSNALTVATLAFYVFWFLATAVGWIPDMFELLAVKGKIDPLSDTAASFTTWIQAFVFSFSAIATLVPNNPQRELSWVNILPAAAILLFDCYLISDNLVSYLALYSSFQKGGDNCKIQALYADDFGNMSSSYDSLPFCSGTEISSLCVGIPSCRAVVADSLVNLQTSAFALLVLLICRAIIWCKVVFGTDKNTAGKRKQVKMNYARKRLRKQGVGQKNDWSLKEQTSTFTETVLSTVREVRDTVLHFFLGNTAAQKSEKTVDINSLSYLPSVVWVAHIVSVLFVITFINYTLESTSQWQENLDVLTSQMQDIRTAIENPEEAASSAVYNVYKQMNTTTAAVSRLQDDLSKNAVMASAGSNMEQACALLIANVTGEPAQALLPDIIPANITAAGLAEDVARSAAAMAIDGNVLGEAAVSLCQNLDSMSFTLQGLQEIANTLSAQISDKVDTKAMIRWVVFIEDFFTSLRSALPYLIPFSSVFALLATAMQIQRSMHAFRDIHIGIRGGKGPAIFREYWEPLNWTVTKANKFCGLQIGSTIAGFAIIFLITVVLTFLITWDKFWEIIWNNYSGLLTTALVVTMLQLLFFEKLIGETILSDKFRILRPGLWTVYSAFMLCLSITTGIAFALTRAVTLICLSGFNVFRLDSTTFPAALASLDSGFSAFMGLQMLWHRHHSPILHAFVESTSGAINPGESEDKANPVQSTSKRIRNKWQLALTLHNNPGLASHRKHALAGTYFTSRIEGEGEQDVDVDVI